jgi:homoserine kinase type II
MIGDEELRAALAAHWDLADSTITAHHGGMNSATWFVARDDHRWVAKSVPAEAVESFRAGLAVAAAVQRAGIPAGAAVPTVDGAIVADVDGRPLALLEWVPGEPLTDVDQRQIGTTLARVHNGLTGVGVDGMEQFHWVDPDADHLDVRPWIRGAVEGAVDALDDVGPRGLLHTDPAPEAFRLDRDQCGLIDWSVAMHGPLLYDVASTAMYLGGPSRATTMLDAYLEATTLLEAAHIKRGLPSMVRFRWAVQADYFARRIATGDLTGISGDAENEKGLEDARAQLRTATGMP